MDFIKDNAMKKLLLALPITAVALSSAHAAPTIYGTVALGVESYVKDFEAKGVDNESQTSLERLAGKVGFKGSEVLTPNTDVIYQLEYNVKPDDNSAQFTARDNFIGLDNKQYGKLRVGRISSIDGNADYTYMGMGMYDNDYGGASWDGGRANNTIAYDTPTYNGLSMGMTYSIDNDKDAVKNFEGKELKRPETFATAVFYEPENQPFRAAAAYYKGDDYSGDNKVQAYKVSAAYDISKDFTIAGLHQTIEPDNSKLEKEKLYALTGTMKTATPWEFYTQLGFIDNFGYVKDAQSFEGVVGGNYNFTKNAMGMVYAGYTDVKDDHTKIGFGTGLMYKF